MTQKTIIEIRDLMLLAAKTAYQNRGITSPNVNKDSDLFVRFDAIADALAIPIAAAENAASEIWIDSCSSDAVLKHAKSVGLEILPGTKATGTVVVWLNTVTSVTIPSAAKLIDNTSGNLYTMTTTGGSFADQAHIAIEADGYGESYNLTYPHSLQWVVPIAGLADFAPITIAAVTGGTDDETIESLRARTQDRIKHTVVGCNPQHLIEIAEKTSNAVQKAFAYPALYGPGSGLLVLQGEATESNGWTRIVSDDIVADVSAAIVAVMPAEVNITVESVGETWTYMYLGLTLPLPPSGGGLGNGWLDAVPYPAPTSGYASIGTTYTDVYFEINSTGPAPVVGDHIAIWSHNTRSFSHVKIIQVVSAVGTSHNVIVDKPVTDLSATDYVSPDCVNLESYALEILAAINKMGPGEATADPLRLPRSLRQPRKETEYYHKLSYRILTDLLKNYPEIADATFGGTPLVPAIPAIDAPPNVLRLTAFAVYAI